MSRKRAFRIAILAGGLALVWIAAFGLPPSWILSREQKADYELLVAAKYFASRAIGYAAVEPPEARAFMSLASHPGGSTALKYLLLRGSPAGKIYALVGLRRTNPWFFSIAVQPFRVWPGEVTTFFGCIISEEPFRTVVATDQPNAVRLAQGQTLKDWWQHRRGTRPDLDIIDGGYTAMFFEWDEYARPAPEFAARSIGVPR